MHIVLEIASALLAIVPIVAVGYAYRGTKSPRLALALVAFGILEVRLISMLVIHTVIEVDHFVEEMLEFGGDLAVLATFSMAFLHGTRRWFGRAPAYAS
jgi:hypothetical protein